MTLTDYPSTQWPATRSHSPVSIASIQGTLALSLLPRSAPPEVELPDRLTAAGMDVNRDRRTAVEGWARRFVQAAVEIVGGDRPASQLLRWTRPDVYVDLRRRAQLVARAGGHQPGCSRVQPVRPRVLSVRACFICPEVVETAVHVRYGERSRALAARFEQVGERWICAALDFS